MMALLIVPPLGCVAVSEPAVRLCFMSFDIVRIAENNLNIGRWILMQK